MAEKSPNRAVPESLVSVVVPVYNGAEVIADTLRSVLSQSYLNLEVIVVDDGSTDGTAQLIRTDFGGDSRLRLVTQQNRGVAAARNTGLAEANGPLIAFVDADDVWRPDKVAKQVALIERAGPRVGVVYTWYANIDRAGSVVPPLRPKPLHRGDVMIPLLLQNFLGNASTALMRTAAVRRVGGYSRHLLERSGGQGSEDWHLYLKLSEICEFDVVGEFLTGYRQAPGTMSRNARALLSNFEAARRDIWARHPDLPPALHLWSELYLLAWIMSRALAEGQRRTAVGLLARAARAVLRDDPFLPFRQATRLFVRYGLELRRHENGAVGDHFLHSDLVADADSWDRSLELREAFLKAIVR